MVIRLDREEAGDEPAFIAVALGNIAPAHGMVQLAKETGLTREGLHNALSAEVNLRFGDVISAVISPNRHPFSG